MCLRSSHTGRQSKWDQSMFIRQSLGSSLSGWTSRKMRRLANETRSKSWMRLFQRLSKTRQCIRCNNSENSLSICWHFLKWYTAFPQIVSRVGISNVEAYKHLSKLISKVIEEYPKQALWLFTSVIKSTKDNRRERGRQILDRLRVNGCKFYLVVGWLDIRRVIQPTLGNICQNWSTKVSVWLMNYWLYAIIVSMMIKSSYRCAKISLN